MRLTRLDTALRFPTFLTLPFSSSVCVCSVHATRHRRHRYPHIFHILNANIPHPMRTSPPPPTRPFVVLFMRRSRDDTIQPAIEIDNTVESQCDDDSSHFSLSFFFIRIDMSQFSLLHTHPIHEMIF